MGALAYRENVINNAPIFRVIMKTKENGRDYMRIKFSSAYYLAKM